MDATISVSTPVFPEDLLNLLAQFSIAQLSLCRARSMVIDAARQRQSRTDTADALVGLPMDAHDHFPDFGCGFVPRINAAFLNVILNP